MKLGFTKDNKVDPIYILLRRSESGKYEFANGCAYDFCHEHASQWDTTACRGLNSLRPVRATRRSGRGRNDAH